MSQVPQPDPDVTRTSIDAARVFPPGAVVAGRYRIVELLGIGGMGMVYHALDEHLELPVALKVLRPERASDHEMRARFKRELILARQVSHKNVVRIHDIGEDGELYFLTMDFVPGRSLKDILEQGPLPLERAVTIAGQLAGALDAAHAEGVVHRDLKPANVLIDDEGQAYVTDFGIARSASATALTATGSVIGTPDYLAPEQARGEATDGRTDVYALGLIFFEMLSGRLPFQGGSLTEVLAQRISGRPATLAEIGVDVPEPVAAAIRRCLARDPEARYSRAGELADDLDAGRAPAQLWPTLTATVRRLARPSTGSPRWLLAAAVAVAAVVIATAVAIGPWRAPPPAADAPRHRVAVLPLTDETGRSELAWISTGLAEIVTAELAESAELRVVEGARIARTLEDLKMATGALPASELKIVAELLDVDRLVTGQVRISGTKIRVDAQLLAADEPDLPAERLHVETGRDEEIFELGSELARALRDRLGVRARGEAAFGTPSAAALEAFTTALAARLDGDDDDAAAALESAVAADPGFIAAWALLTETYDRLGFADKAREAARESIALLPADAADGRLALHLRARQATLAGEPDRAETLLRQLVERYPYDVGARVMLATALGAGGRYEAANAVLEEVTARDPNHPSAWYLLGKFAIMQGDSRRAIDEYLTRALVVQNRLGNRQEQADVLNAFGIAFQKLGDLDGAAERYHQATELLDTLGNQRAHSRALFNLASIYALKGDHQAARASLEEVLEIRRELGDYAGIASAENHLGSLAEQQGQVREALDHYQRSLDLRREMADPLATAESLTNVGFVHYLLGEHEPARAHWDEARAIFQESGNREGEIFVAQSVAQLELARGRWDRALSTLLEILELSREIGKREGEALAKGYLGRVAQYQGRYRAAFASYREALELLSELEDVRGLVEFTLAEADAALELGALDDAGALLEKARGWLAETENREQRAELWRLDGERFLASGRPREAAASFARAVAEAEASGSRRVQLWTRLSEGRARVAGRPAEAADALSAVIAESAALGDLMLELRGRAALARARIANGETAAAEDELRRALELARDHEPVADAYRLHLARAELLRIRDADDQARAELAAAARQLERLRANLDPPARATFDQLPEVQKIDRETDPQTEAEPVAVAGHHG